MVAKGQFALLASARHRGTHKPARAHTTDRKSTKRVYGRVRGHALV